MIEIPNVKLAVSQKTRALPEGLCNIGMYDGIQIPNVEKQLEGFYVRQAGVLVAQFPQYKFIQVKGQKNDQSITI